MKIFVIYFIVILVVAGIGFFLFRAEDAPNTENLPGEFFTSLGAEHLTDGVTEHAPYNSNPPTSGPHWPVAAEWGVNNTPEKDERYIHNLEHGGIWISYKPSLPAETITLLNDFAQRYRKVVVTPREANDSNIALAAWEYLEKLESYDENKILEFIQAHYDKGPEKVP